MCRTAKQNFKSLIMKFDDQGKIYGLLAKMFSSIDLRSDVSLLTQEILAPTSPSSQKCFFFPFPPLEKAITSFIGFQCVFYYNVLTHLGVNRYFF